MGAIMSRVRAVVASGFLVVSVAVGGAHPAFAATPSNDTFASATTIAPSSFAIQ